MFTIGAPEAGVGGRPGVLTAMALPHHLRGAAWLRGGAPMTPVMPTLESPPDDGAGLAAFALTPPAAAHHAPAPHHSAPSHLRRRP